MIKHKNRNFLRLLFHCVLFLTVISACSLIRGGITPDDAVRKTLSSPDFQIALVRQFKEGAVVLYHNPQPEFIPGDLQNPSFQLGYSYVDKKDLQWWVRSGVSGSFTPEQGSKVIFLLDQVQFGAPDQKRNKPDDLSVAIIVFGKVLDQSIETVEVRDEEGTKILDFVSGSMFVMIESPGTTPCKLRFMEKNGEVIESFDLVTLEEWQSSQVLMEKIKDACTE